MKVLLSAYACRPGIGSEPEVGLKMLTAAAEANDVWLMTPNDNIDLVKQDLAERNLLSNITFCGVSSSKLTVHQAVRKGRVSAYRHYESWQAAAANYAMELDEACDFDVVHHVTYANYWAGIGAAAVPKPLLVGPVGGGVKVPTRMLPLFGVKGAMAEGLRAGTQTVLGRRFRRIERRARTMVFYQNEATRRIGRGTGPIVPNATLVAPPLPEAQTERTDEVVVVGGLEPRKGHALALRAWAHLSHPEARLVFLGEGPLRSPLERLARKLGVAQRTEFRGKVPREVVASTVARARAMFHPSLRDEASLAIAEALSLGTPVVALEPCAADLASVWETTTVLVKPESIDNTAKRFAAELDEILSRPRTLTVTERVEPSVVMTAAALEAYQQLAS